MRNRSDEIFLARAVALALKGSGHTRPNPPVGALVVKSGRIIGEGWHRRAGGDHAEVAALKDCVKRGESPEGSSVYVTLEPCSKPGRVGACTDALIAAKVSEVVYACRDPNPVNAARAARVLKKAGIVCRRSAHPDAERLIAPFAKFILTGLPFITVKIAMSLDGKICDLSGASQWISSPAARRLTGSARERVDAIMIGAETLRKDNPSLLSHGRRNDDLVRVIVTESARLPQKAKVFTDGAVNRTIVLKVPRGGSLADAMRSLARQGLMHVYCEGGLALARSLAAEGLVDEWISVISPKVIGDRPISEAAEIKKAFFISDNLGAFGESAAYLGRGKADSI